MIVLPEAFGARGHTISGLIYCIGSLTVRI